MTVSVDTLQLHHPVLLSWGDDDISALLQAADRAVSQYLHPDVEESTWILDPANADAAPDGVKYLRTELLNAWWQDYLLWRVPGGVTLTITSWIDNEGGAVAMTRRAPHVWEMPNGQYIYLHDEYIAVPNTIHAAVVSGAAHPERDGYITAMVELLLETGGVIASTTGAGGSTNYNSVQEQRAALEQAMARELGML